MDSFILLCTRNLHNTYILSTTTFISQPDSQKKLLEKMNQTGLASARKPLVFIYKPVVFRTMRIRSIKKSALSVS
jgi:hypothetical protein